MATDKLKELKVDRIVFYNAGKIFYACARGWLDDERSGYGRDLYSLDVPILKRAIKEDLNRKDCYYMAGRREYSFDDSYAVYINTEAAGIKVTTGKTTKDFRTPTEQHYHTELKIEGLDGTFEKDNCTEIIVFLHAGSKPTKEAPQIEAVKKRLDKIFTNTSTYDVEKFLKEFPEVKND